MNIKKQILICSLCFAVVPAFAQHSLNIIREVVMIPMRDSVKLGAILYRPLREGKFPVIVFRTPYGADDYDSLAQFPLKAAKKGYAVLLVDVRGRFRSEGEFEAYRNEKKDGYDVIEWAPIVKIPTGGKESFLSADPGLLKKLYHFFPAEFR